MSTPADIEQRVDAILKKMSLEEKIDYIGGVDGFYIRANERLGLPALKMADGPLGIKNNGPSTAYPGGIALAASWDTELAQRMGAMIGRDARARGVHFLLGPGVNMYRAPMCGRNFEYFGEDPFLAARITVGYIAGVQAQGVSATVKHFLGNNSEIDRHHTSSDIDERTLREIYLPTFEAAVKEAHVGAVMNAYNLVNGVHMTQHAALNVELLKKEWGFDGILMSDWDATYDAIAAANAGLDLEMPSAKFMNRATLLPAVEQGKVTVATIDDKVRRILRKAIQFGWLDREQTDTKVSLFSQEGRALALEAARSSMVLLKNEGQLLPLDKKKIQSVAVIGPDAYPAVPGGGGSARVTPFLAVSYLQGLADHLAGTATVRFNRGATTLSEIFDSTDFVTAAKDGQRGLTGEYFDNDSLKGTPRLTRVDERVNFNWDRPQVWPLGRGKDVSARWTGFFIPPTSGDYRWAISSYGLNEYRLFLDGKLLFDRARQKEPIAVNTVSLDAGHAYAIRLEYVHRDHHSNLGLGLRRADRVLDANVHSLAASADVAIVFAGFDPTNEGEGQDRTFALPLGQDELIEAVRRANRNTIVVVTSGGGVDMARWADSIPAILQAWYPGQEGGIALAQILFGEFSPSGKLPVTFERRWEDSAVHGSYYPNADKRIVYREGVFSAIAISTRPAQSRSFPLGTAFRTRRSNMEE
jgi:beta-glucosidase